MEKVTDRGDGLHAATGLVQTNGYILLTHVVTRLGGQVNTNENRLAQQVPPTPKQTFLLSDVAQPDVGLNQY